nr:leucyl aminopeptidase [Hymenolepis microstoma]
MLMDTDEIGQSSTGDNRNPPLKRNKRAVITISTYNSDDDDDDDLDLEDDAPLSEIRAGMAPFPACDKELVDLTNEATPPPSDDESSTLTEDQKDHIVTVMSKAGHSELCKVSNATSRDSLLSLWVNSSKFQTFRPPRMGYSCFGDKERVPRSFVVHFYETLKSNDPSTSNSVIKEQNFGAVLLKAQAHWKSLTSEERKAYRKRAIHSKASYSHHLLERREKLNSLISRRIPICANPSCQNLVVYDNRWDLDYCSPDCVLANSKFVFENRFQNSFSTIVLPANENPIVTPSSEELISSALSDSHRREGNVSLENGNPEVEIKNKSLNLQSAVSHMETNSSTDNYIGGNIFERVANIGQINRVKSEGDSHYTVIYNILTPRVPQNNTKESESTAVEETEKESINWKNVSQDKLRVCIARGVQALQKLGVSEIFVDPCADAEVAAEAAFLAAFSFDELKNQKRRVSQPPISCFTAHLDNDPDAFETKSKLQAAWDRGRILAQSQNQARRWMEMPANMFYPEVFAHAIEEAMGEAMKSSAEDASLNVEVYDTKWIKQQGMGGVLGVSRGSDQAPYFVEISYVGDPSRPNDHIALVGKGVTFDSGGISIKPATGMGDMRGDMGGAAVIASVLTGIIQLQSPINVRVYLPLVENMPDGRAMRPGDVIRMANGSTVQVDNTDAEGRLILADALHYAQSRNPFFIMDAATLTGAISISLGDAYTGIFCNRSVQRRQVLDIWPLSEAEKADAGRSAAQGSRGGATIIGALNHCGRTKCDPFWHMPNLYARHLIDGCATADIANITSGAYAKLAGSGSASAFLQNFVKPTIPFIHLDIAGVMKTVVDDAVLRRGMSGRPTRALVHFLDNLARHNFRKQERNDKE